MTKKFIKCHSRKSGNPSLNQHQSNCYMDPCFRGDDNVSVSCTKKIDYQKKLLFLSLFVSTLIYAQPIEHDPTQPVLDIQTPTVKTEQKEMMHLQAIIVSPGRRFAVINEQYVAPGEQISDAKVVAIEKNAVILKTPAGQKTLYLFDEQEWEQSP